MSEKGLDIHGWKIYAHPLFLEQFEALIAQVEIEKAKNPETYSTKRVSKLLAAVIKVAFEDIPSDPARPAYRQGDTLGSDFKHWRRAKFLQRYRLFFRYRQAADAKVIVLTWLNDEKTLRAYGSKTDAYAVFRKMLDGGNPPDDWSDLMEEALARSAQRRLRRAVAPERT